MRRVHQRPRGRLHELATPGEQRELKALLRELEQDGLVAYNAITRCYSLTPAGQEALDQHDTLATSPVSVALDHHPNTISPSNRRTSCLSPSR